MSKTVIIFLLFFFPKISFAQYGLDRFPKVCPDDEHVLVGYPQPKYFQKFGKKYVHTLYQDYGFPKRFKSTFKLKKDKIKVRIKLPFSYAWFKETKWYKIVDGKILRCNRFGSTKKYAQLTDSTKYEIIDQDSVVHVWTYSIFKNDSTIFQSERYIFNNGNLTKYESTPNYYAYTDSTWNLAATRPISGRVARSTFQYISKNEVKILSETISNKNHDSLNVVLKFIYDLNGKITEIDYCHEKSKDCDFHKFYYQDALCITYEWLSDDKITERITITKK